MARVTINDIARDLDISRGTVDRALHNRPGISGETKFRIRTRAIEMGYEPNKTARLLAMNKTRTIAVIRPSHSLDFYNQLDRGIKSAELEMKDQGLVVKQYLTSRHDALREHELFEKALADKPDAIAVIPVDPDSLTPLIDKASDAGIPVVTFNIDAPGSKRLFFTGQDLNKSGRTAAELFGRMLPSGGSIAILTGNLHTWAFSSRIEGFKNELTEYSPGIKIAGTYEYGEDRQQAAGLAEALLAENPDLCGFYSTSEYGVTGVADVLKRRKSAGIKCINIGYDLNDEIRQFLKDDLVQAVICQDPFVQGFFPIKFLWIYLTEGNLPDHNIMNTRIDVIFRNNIPVNHPEGALSPLLRREPDTFQSD